MGKFVDKYGRGHAKEKRRLFSQALLIHRKRFAP